LKLRLFYALRPYRATPGITLHDKNVSHTYSAAESNVDYIQSILGPNECNKLIKQAYEDIKMGNLGLGEKVK
jgi:hypothetical protein